MGNLGIVYYISKSVDLGRVMFDFGLKGDMGTWFNGGRVIGLVDWIRDLGLGFILNTLWTRFKDLDLA